jgi:hypothetical protein
MSLSISSSVNTPTISVQNNQKKSWLPTASQALSASIKIAPLAIAIFTAASLEGADAGVPSEVACIGFCHARFWWAPIRALATYDKCMMVCAALGVAPLPYGL